MTVGELIEFLRGFQPDTRVVVSAFGGYGDPATATWKLDAYDPRRRNGESQFTAVVLDANDDQYSYAGPV